MDVSFTVTGNARMRLRFFMMVLLFFLHKNSARTRQIDEANRRSFDQHLS